MNTNPPSNAANRLSYSDRPSWRPSDTPRHQAENRSAKDRFASKLERDNQGSGGERKGGAISASAEGALAPDQRVQDRSQGGGSGSGGQDGLAQQSPMMLGMNANGAGLVSGAAQSAFDPAMLERMAAQIAESWPSAGVQDASIQFPEGSLAESAMIRREPDGSVAIRLAGIDPRLTAREAARAQMELSQALALRKLKVNSVTFERISALHRGLNSAIPRAV